MGLQICLANVEGSNAILEKVPFAAINRLGKAKLYFIDMN
jgi:hypothetical protein